LASSTRDRAGASLRLVLALATMPIAGKAAGAPPGGEPLSVIAGQASTITLSIPGGAGDNQYFLAPGGAYVRHSAVVGGNIRDMAVENGYAYLATGPTGLLIAAVSADESPRIVGRLGLGIEVNHVVAAGHLIALAAADDVVLVDVTNVTDPTVLGHFVNAGSVSHMALSETRLYLSGETEHVVVVDLSHPASPIELADQPLGVSAIESLAVRDGRLYVAAGDDGLLVLDGTSIPEVKTIGSYRTTGPALDLGVGDGGITAVASGHGGVTLLDTTDPTQIRWIGSHQKIGDVQRILVQGERALVLNRRGGLALLDISQPALPDVVATLRPDEPVVGFGLSGTDAFVASLTALQHIDCSPSPPTLSNEGLDFGEGVNYGGERRAFIRNDVAFVADWFSGIHIYDISEPHQPRLISSFHTSGSPKGIVVRDNYAFVADDDHGLQVIDVSDLRRPQRVAELATAGLAYTPVLDGDLLYLASHRGGFQIIDVHDPTQPRLVGEFDTPGKAWSIQVAGSVAYVADAESGLLVFDVGDPKAPRQIGAFNPGGDAEDILLDGDYAYAAFFDDGLYVLDISDPSAPAALAHLPTPGNARGLAYRAPLLYLADWLAGVHIIDVSDRTHPKMLGSYDTEGAAWGVRLNDDFGFVLDWWGGFTVLDVADPARPVLAGRYHDRGSVHDLATVSNFAFVAQGDGGLQVFDIRNPLNPTWVTGIDLDAANALAVAGARAYVANGEKTLTTVDISDPFTVHSVASIELPFAIDTLRTADGKIYAASRTNGIAVLDTGDGDAPELIALQPGSLEDIAPTARGILVAAGARGLDSYALVGSNNLIPDANLPTHQPVTRVLTDGDRVITLQSGRGVGIAEAATENLRDIAVIPMRDPLDLQLAGDTLYVLFEGGLLVTIDIAVPSQWRIKSTYRIDAAVDRLRVNGDVVYLGGSDQLVALRTLPDTPLQPRENGRLALTLSPELPLGTYDLGMYAPRQGTLDPLTLQRLPAALRVVMPRFSKPKFSMEDLKRALEERHIAPQEPAETEP